MQAGTNSDLARAMFAAYRTKDRKFVEGMLSDDFSFTSPLDDHIDRATYMERCWPNSEHIVGHDLERVWERGDEVFVRYLCHKDDGKRFRNAELLSFEGGKLKGVEVYFGADA
ncbi:MAG: nuclear transport factor 2 family protein [Solirubrobacterales bacterium]|nr:nuclear transport factor 2 family protein [Solirubrobacterales bacterium]